MDDCIFCRIIARQAPAYVIHEDDRVIVFLSLESHPLVVPKAHIPDIYTLDDDTASAVMQTATRVARAVKAGLHCDGVYLTQANEPAAGQDVFHFHLHVYPRRHGDGLRFIGPAQQTDPAVLARLQEQLRAALHAAD
jgi:histidine triad (HIT) family protein